jgi:diaminopimelate epimerase
MDPLAYRPVVKMNGLGNEIVVLDLRQTDLVVTPPQARAIGRGQGLYFDQLMVLHDPVSPNTEAFMRIYNIDGSEAGACGNGTRCVASVLLRDRPSDELILETASAHLPCNRETDGSFSVDMGPPHLGWADIPLREPVADTGFLPLRFVSRNGAVLEAPSGINMGNPHAVFFVDDLARFDLDEIGPPLETHPLFPDRANISLAHIIARNRIELKVWERGAGQTRACGSAACATLVAAVLQDRAERKAKITLPGGDLLIFWRQTDDHVIMTGPVEWEFEAKLDPQLFAEIAA